MLRETFISAIEIVLNRKTKILLCIKTFKTKILLCIKPEGTLLCRLSRIEKRIKEQTSKVNIMYFIFKSHVK
jgi:uncharacterized membrane-anchored protein